MTKKIYLILILVLAAFLRFWRLDYLSLFGDEVDVGYQAYSLLLTGKDYMGQALPLYIHSLSEWRAPVLMYASIPGIALFGLNEFGVRFTPALFGVLGVLLIYLLGKKLVNEKFGLTAALVLSILPWHIHYSRAAFEATLLVDLVLGGIVLLLRKDKWSMVFSAILFALTPYTYSTAALFTPLFIITILWARRSILDSTRIKQFCVVFAILILPFFYLTQFGPASGRFSLLSVFNDEKIIDQINIERGETWKNEERFFHNKLVGWGEVIISNYGRAFSPDFLFVNGDPNPRHNLPGTGVLYWGLLPFLLYGFYKIFQAKSELRWSILSWLLLAPIPTSLTTDGANHATRLFLLIIPLTYITSYGVTELWQRRSILAKMVALTGMILVTINVFFYIHRYYSHYQYQNWKYWNFGYKEAISEVVKNQDKYDKVFINNSYQPSLLNYLFWSKYDPAKFQKEFSGDIPQEKMITGFNGFKLDDKLYFGEAKEAGGFLQSGELYLAAQQKEIPGDWDWEKTTPEGIKVLSVIYTPKDAPLFTIFTRQ